MRAKKNKVLRVLPDKYEELLHNGFSLFKDDTEQVYAMKIKLDYFSDIVTHIINVINSEVFKKSKFSSEFEYDENGYVVFTDEQIEEITNCELCASLGENDDDLTAGLLFINAPDKTSYYGAKLIKKHCKDIIKVLKKKKIVKEEVVERNEK